MFLYNINNEHRLFVIVYTRKYIPADTSASSWACVVVVNATTTATISHFHGDIIMVLEMRNGSICEGQNNYIITLITLMDNIKSKMNE